MEQITKDKIEQKVKEIYWLRKSEVLMPNAHDFKAGVEFGYSLAKEEVPEITVYRTVKASERKPEPMERVMWTRTDISGAYSGYYSGNRFFIPDGGHACYAIKYIEWLEPISLKELLAELNQ